MYAVVVIHVPATLDYHEINHLFNPPCRPWLGVVLSLAALATAATKGQAVARHLLHPPRQHRLHQRHPFQQRVHPPRPADPRAAWEPQWAVKLRVKSMATPMAGMPSMGEAMKAETGAPGGQAGAANRDGAPRVPGAVDLLRGLFGR